MITGWIAKIKLTTRRTEACAPWGSHRKSIDQKQKKDQVRAVSGVKDQRNELCPSHLLCNPKVSQEVTWGFALGREACSCRCPQKNDTYTLLNRVLLYMRKKKAKPKNYIEHISVKLEFFAELMPVYF